MTDPNEVLVEMLAITRWLEKPDNQPYQYEDDFGCLNWYGDIGTYMVKSQRLAELLRGFDHDLPPDGSLPSDWCNHYRS